MEWWEWIVVGVGVAVVVAVLVDVVLTVLHQDVEGPIARFAQGTTWWLARALARGSGRGRRHVLAAAGPAMMVVTFAVWIALFIVGFALVVWPQLDGSYVTDRTLQKPLGFIDALYYSGITGSVLGYGDITPVRAPGQLIAFTESALGFALLTAIVTYLLSVLDALGERSTLALRLHHEAGEGGGAELLRESAGHEEPADVRRRIEHLAEALAVVEERLHRFPRVSLYFRSVQPKFDPEPMFERLMEVGVGARLLAAEDNWRSTRVAAMRLGRTLSDTAVMLADGSLGRGVAERMRSPTPGQRERERITRVAHALGRNVRDSTVKRALEDRSLLVMVFRQHALLDELDRVTAWRADRIHDQNPQPEE